MNQDSVLCNISNNVAWITLNRPERSNSITPEVILLLLKYLQSLEKDLSIRVIVFTSTGKYFSTGMDLSSTNQKVMKETDLNITDKAISLWELIMNYPKPIIARINGSAMAGGWGLLFGSDIRIAVKDATFCFSEVKYGLVPAIISTYIVPQLGLYAKTLFLTGEKISAHRAWQIGFLTEVAEDLESLDQITDRYIQILLKNGPSAMNEIKKLWNFIGNHDHEKNLIYVKGVYEKMMQSEEALYGISSFSQKKVPDWSKFYSNKSKL